MTTQPTPDRWTAQIGDTTITCLSDEPNRDVTEIMTTLTAQGWVREELHPDGICELTFGNRRIHISDDATEVFGIDPEAYELVAVNLDDPIWREAVNCLTSWLAAEMMA
jgi:hypothetical protein